MNYFSIVLVISRTIYYIVYIKKNVFKFERLETVFFFCYKVQTLFI